MSDTSVECSHCGRTVGNLAGLSAHMRSMHQDRVGNQPPARPATREAPPAASNSGLVWEDPPAMGRRGDPGRLIAVARIPELRRNPKRWARLYTWNKKTRASLVAGGLRKNETFTDIEFRARALPDGTSALYGRYTGE